MKSTVLAWVTAVLVASLNTRQVRGKGVEQLVVKIPSDARMPSDAPSLVPSDAPSATPSSIPSSLVDVSLNEASLSDFPSMAPSNVPSATSSKSPSAGPSDVPSTMEPIKSSSDQPSRIPSVVPSTGPSDVPSNSPIMAPSKNPSDQPSQSPSVVPSEVPSDKPSQSPSRVPTIVPSGVPSNAPSQSPSNAPSSVPTARPSDMPSRSPSFTPSFQPTEDPSDIATPISTASPSFGPSTMPSSSPSDGFTKAPTDAPSVSPTTAPTRLLASLQSLKVTETSVAIQSRSTTLMTDEELEQFQSICTDQFLPEFLPRVQDTKFEQISCKILDQRIVNSSRMLRKLQEIDNGAMAIDVKTQVSAHVDVSDESFSDIVAVAFDVFSDEFSTLLSSASSVFVAPVSVKDTDRFASIQDSDQVKSEDNDWSETPLLVLVTAIAGGTLLAVVLAAFAVRRRRGHTVFRTNFNPVITNDYASGAGMITGDGASSEEEMDKYDSSRAQSSTFPRSLGIISSGDSVDEIILAMTNSASMHSGVPNKNSSFSKRSTQPRNSRTSEESNRKHESPVTHLPPLNRSSDEESSLRGLKFVPSIQTSSENSDKKSVIMPFNFGFRRKYSNRSRISDSYDDMARYLSNSNSEFSDVSIDPSRPAGTPMASSKVLAKIEECEAATPRSNFIRQKQTHTGDRFVQMSINEALHTGDVLDDLGKLENEFANRSVMGETKFSASSAETFKQGNSSSRLKPFIRDIISPTDGVSGSYSGDKL